MLDIIRNQDPKSSKQHDDMHKYLKKDRQKIKTRSKAAKERPRDSKGTFNDKPASKKQKVL